MPERPGLGRRIIDRLRGRRDPAPPEGEALDLDLDGGIAYIEGLAGAEIFDDAAAALGAALAGRRVALATSLTDDVGALIRPLLGRAAPAVIWIEADAVPAPGRLPAGAIVFAPGGPQEAIDLALVARRVTEEALLPVVLLVGRWPERSLSVPDAERISELLGGATDDVDSPTAPQRALFGPTRRRVPRWFDGGHPMAIGGRARDGLAAARALSQHAVFEVPAGELARAACEAVEAITGRPLPPVWLEDQRKASQTVVAAGPLGAVPLPGVRLARLLRLQPFPAGYLASVLEGSAAVAVLQDGPDTGPGSLFAATEAAASVPPRVAWRPASGAGPAEDDPQLLGSIRAFVDGSAARLRLGSDAAPTSAFPRRDAAVQALIEAAPSLFEESAGGGVIEAPVKPGVEPPLPALLRRIPASRPAPDSLPRFWGEVLQPRRAGLPTAPSAVLATGAVPGGASALQPAVRGETTLPVLDPELCTGCGACWAACPDSAFAATALTLPALLDAAADVTGLSGKAAGAVRRGHKNLAGRAARSLADSPVPDRPQWRDAWDWLAGKGKLAEDRETHDEIWRATEDVLVDLRPFGTEVLFDRAEAAAKGTGALLLLGVDPDACTGCGLCVASCEPDALRQVPRTEDVEAEARAHHSVHEGLPDTSGDTIAWLEAQPEGDPVRALLLSRHCAEAQVGGGTTEPGSGARLAARLAVAFAEEHGARGQAGLASALEGLRGSLQDRVGAILVESASQASAAVLARAAAGTGARVDLAELAQQLDNGGQHATVDADALRRLADTELAIDSLLDRLRVGADGLGAARFAAVVSAPALEPLLRYPGHPWFAPTVVAEPGDVVAVAQSLARSLVDEHVDAIRWLRRADLLVRDPGDLRARLAALDSLAWADLSADDRAACPPLLVLVGPPPGAPADASGFAGLLGEDLPVRILLLDGAEAPGAGPDPALLAVASGSAWVGATSAAFPEHLGPTLRAALRAQGPSLVVLHAPSPERLGFASNRTLDVARKAVEARVSPLFRFDPSRDPLHARFDLGGNPADAEAGSFGDWLAAQPGLQARLDAGKAASAERAVSTRWAALQALAGPPEPAPVPVAPPPPPVPRDAIERELRGVLASNLRRLARGPAGS